MRVLVLGAGAIGGLVGALLAEKGHEVEARGRSGRLASMRVEGGGYGLDRDVAFAALSRPPELVLAATKTQDLADALRQHARDVGDAPVLALQNGLAQDAIVRDVLGRAGVPVVVALDAQLLESGRVECARKGTLLVPRGAPGVEALRDAVRVEETDDIEGARWTKLLVNLQNAVPALTGLSYQEAARHPLLGRAVVRMLKEARAVADAEGVTLAPLPWTSPLLLRALSRLPEDVARPLYARRVAMVLGAKPAYGSTWQSVQRGRSVETEYLNGEVVRRGAKHGIPTPTNARACELAAAGARLSAEECGRSLLRDG